MRTSTGLCLMTTLAGLALAGCASKTARVKSPPVTVAANEVREPESPRDHWLRRDLEDKGERTFERANSR